MSDLRTRQFKLNSAPRRRTAAVGDEPIYENRAVRRPTEENLGQWDGGIRGKAIDWEEPNGNDSWGKDPRDPITRHAKMKRAKELEVRKRVAAENSAKVAIKIAKIILGTEATPDDVQTQSFELLDMPMTSLVSTYNRLTKEQKVTAKEEKDEVKAETVTVELEVKPTVELAKVEAAKAEPAKAETKVEAKETKVEAKAAEPKAEPAKVAKVEPKKVVPKKAADETDSIGDFISDSDAEGALGDFMSEDMDVEETEDVADETEEAIGEAEDKIDEVEEGAEGAEGVIETQIPESIPEEAAENIEGIFGDIVEAIDSATGKEAKAKKAKIGPIRKSASTKKTDILDGVFTMSPDVTQYFSKRVR